jgi:hypothetical protein
MLLRILRERFYAWLVEWVFLADDVVQLLTFTVFDLGPSVERSHEWMIRRWND